MREKDINPLHPWDTSLPLFISDPRYVLLPSVSARRDAFDEYCRDRAREVRQENVKKEKTQANPKEEFDSLLHEHVKSTRTVWSDFRRAWKKDRRFYGWGRDDREREKRFKDYLKELGESASFLARMMRGTYGLLERRAAAEKAEADFFALLRECSIVKSDSVWKDVSHFPFMIIVSYILKQSFQRSSGICLMIHGMTLLARPHSERNSLMPSSKPVGRLIVRQKIKTRLTNRCPVH